MIVLHVILVAGAASALVLGPLQGQASLPTLYPIDQAHSQIGFSVRFMGLSRVRGTLANFSGSIVYDSLNPARGSVSVMIQSQSINTGQQRRDNHLRSRDFLDVQRYPVIAFRSEVVERDGAGLVMRGPLTLHGVTREVAIQFTQLHGRDRDAWGNHRIGFEGTTRISRRDFNVVGGTFWNSEFDPGRFAVGDTLEIELTIEGSIWNFDAVRRVAEGKLSIQGTLMPVVEARGIKPGRVRDHRDLSAGAGDVAQRSQPAR